MKVEKMFCSSGWSKEKIVCLCESEPTVDGVLCALDSRSRVHLGCYGFQDPKLGLKHVFVSHEGIALVRDGLGKQVLGVIEKNILRRHTIFDEFLQVSISANLMFSIVTPRVQYFSVIVKLNNPISSHSYLVCKVSHKS
jgi:hypothetical protein